MAITSNVKITVKECPGGYNARAVVDDPPYRDGHFGRTVEEAIGNAFLSMYQDEVITYDWPVFIEITLPAPTPKE